MEDEKKDPSFSIYEFSSWLSKQNSFKSKKSIDMKNANISENLIGKKVESRIGLQRLEQKIKENNETKKYKVLSEDFKTNGGKITSVSKLLVLIEVRSGEFLIPKIYTKVQK